MRRFLVVLCVLVGAFMVSGCDVLDWALLDEEQQAAKAETKAAREEMEKAEKELAAVKKQLAAAETDEEKAAAAVALGLTEKKIAVAEGRVAAALAGLEEAIKNTGGSNLEKLAGIAGGWIPWITALGGAIAGTYKHVSMVKERGAKETAQGAVREFAIGFENVVEKLPDKGKEEKKKLGSKFEKAGVATVVDVALKGLGLLKKSA